MNMRRRRSSPSRIVECGFEIARHRGRVLKLRLDLVGELLLLALVQRVCGGSRRWRDAWRWPSARRRDCRARPLCGHCSSADDERVLRELLGEADVAHHPREPADDLRRLDAPHGFDGAVHVLDIVDGPSRGIGASSRKHGPSSRTSTVAHCAAGHSPAMATASSWSRNRAGRSRRPSPWLRRTVHRPARACRCAPARARLPVRLERLAGAPARPRRRGRPRIRACDRTARALPLPNGPALWPAAPRSAACTTTWLRWSANRSAPIDACKRLVRTSWRSPSSPRRNDP